MYGMLTRLSVDGLLEMGVAVGVASRGRGSSEAEVIGLLSSLERTSNEVTTGALVAGRAAPPTSRPWDGEEEEEGARCGE